MFFSKKVIGIDIGTSSIKMAELDVSQSKAQLVRFGYSPLPAGAVMGGEINDPALVSDTIRNLYLDGAFKRKSCSTGMFGTSVITRKISMPKMDRKLLGEQIRWEAEQYIPFSIDEVSLDFHVLNTKNHSENLDVMIVAAKQDYVFRYLEAISSAGLKPSVVDVAGFSLANCFEFNYGRRPEVVALLNIGAGVTNFVVVENGEVVYCRDIPVGGINFTADIQKEMGVSPDEAESLKVSASQNQAVPQEVQSSINGTNELVAEEIHNGFEFYGATANGASISRFYVTGGSYVVPGLIDQISKVTRVPAEILNPFNRIRYNPKGFSPDYILQISPFVAICLGLGLRKEGDS